MFALLTADYWPHQAVGVGH